MIVDIKKSPIKHKRFRLTMDNGKTYDFGLQDGFTYIDGATEETRRNYLKRHLGNSIEKRLIENLVPSSSLFSAYLLWGNSRDLYKNIEFLNDLWKKKHLNN